MNRIKTSDGAMLGFSEFVTIQSKPIIVYNFTQFDRTEITSLGIFNLMKCGNSRTSHEINACYVCLPF
jgi:hypothetical protein